jgi:hypothetical protein
MGNRSSVLKDKKQEIPIMNFKQLNENNTEFLTKLNEIATDYILGQNFQDMVKLTNSKYCDDLVIITSKILKKSFFSKQIQTIYKTVVVGSDSQTGVGSLASMNDLNEPISNEKNRQMCIEIAKYYVKVAHLFAAIITTLNPVFSWKSSASSSRAILSPHIPEPPPQSQAPTDVDADADVAVEDNVAITALENKQYIPEMAKNVKVENLNFCNSRISDLIDMEEISDLIDGKNSIPNKDDTGVKSTESEIKIKTKLCSSNLNNIDSVGRNKTVYDLPGFAELTRLYNDKYNASKGRFDRMSAKSKEEKKRNVDLLYTLFTGDPKPPKDIKNFRDIPLHSFSDTADCSNIDSLLNKTYTGTTKDKLFVDYVEQIKKMIYESNMIRNSLLEIIDGIFVSNTDSGEAPIQEDPKSRMKYMIDPELTYERLNELITESRKIILKLYVNCEKNFIYTLKILQAIIETQMFETGQRQIRELERNIDAEY